MIAYYTIVQTNLPAWPVVHRWHNQPVTFASAWSARAFMGERDLDEADFQIVPIMDQTGCQESNEMITGPDKSVDLRYGGVD